MQRPTPKLRPKVVDGKVTPNVTTITQQKAICDSTWRHSMCNKRLLIVQSQPASVSPSVHAFLYLLNNLETYVAQLKTLAYCTGITSNLTGLTADGGHLTACVNRWAFDRIRWGDSKGMPVHVRIPVKRIRRCHGIFRIWHVVTPLFEPLAKNLRSPITFDFKGIARMWYAPANPLQSLRQYLQCRVISWRNTLQMYAEWGYIHPCW